MEINGKSFNEYHRIYYQQKIKGCKKQCECGEMVDVYRFTRHRKMKKHLRKLENQNTEKDISLPTIETDLENLKS